MRLIFIVLPVIVIIGILAVALNSVKIGKPDETSTMQTQTPQPSQAPSGPQATELKIEDEKLGTGIEAVSGKSVTVNYVGTLTDGTKFDSSYDRNTPFTFHLGAGEVIKGWDQGVVGMKVGGKRKLTIPSDLAYGPSGIPPTIPGGATLIFEIELLDVK